MTTTTLDSGTAARADEPIPLLDPNPRRLGPVSRRLLFRLLVLVALVEAIGAALTFGIATESSRAAGLSLVFPGGGFLYTGHPIAFLVTIALVLLAFVVWWGLSAHFAIPLVWFGSAAVAYALADAPRVLLDRGTTWAWAIPVVYLAAVALVGGVLWKFERRFRSKRSQVEDLNGYLAEVDISVEKATPREPNDVDAALLRWCYDLANQLDDGLKGFDWGEQFHGGTQLRYQVNTYCWALSSFAANYVPNGSRQIEEALARMVLKHTDLRVWGYWRTLNLLGNFDANPDPIVRDNIMFSAFLGDVLNMFEASTGSTRFDEPGSLTFVWKDGRTFPYDHHTIAEAVERNFRRSNLGFFPCEPGWSFTVCNIFGAQALLGHDTLHDTAMWPGYRDRWVETLENEYLEPDGTYSHIRSNLVGLSWDTGETPGGSYTAQGTGRLSDILPTHGRRAKALDLRQAAPMMEVMSSMVADGTLPMELPAEPERHRTRSSPLHNWTRILGGARMVGDETLAEAAINGGDAQCFTGVRWPELPMSSGAHFLGGHLMVRWSTPLGPADLNVRGYEPPVGPVLDDTAWGSVVVVLARSPDGVALDLALLPSDDVPLEAVQLRFTQLRPSTRYVLAGTALVSDAAGTGTANVDVDGLTRLRLAPLETEKDAA